MNERDAPTLPFLRSRAQEGVLAALFLHPDREYSVTELAIASGISQPTASREVARLSGAQLISHRDSGRNRYVRANADHALFTHIRAMVDYSHGPLVALPSILNGLAGVERAYIFGSWARRHLGAQTDEPRDIDVVAIGHPDRLAVHTASGEASEHLGMEVNIHPVAPEAWASGSDAFVKNVKGGPLVEVPLQGAAS